MTTSPGNRSPDPAWARWAAKRRRSSRRRWVVVVAAALVWLLDTALIVRSGLYNPALRWGLGDVIRWEFVIATVVTASLVLAWSRLPLIHAWACLSQLAPLVGFDLGWPRYSDTSAPYIGAALTGVWPAAVAALVLRCPSPRLSLPHQRWTACLLAMLPTLSLLELLTMDPERIGRFGDQRLMLAWPPAVHDHVVFPCLAVAEFAGLAITTGLQVRRGRATPRTARPGLLALAMASGLVTVMNATTRTVEARFWWTGPASLDASDWNRWMQTLATSWVLGPAILALACMVEVFQSRSAQAAAVGRVVVAARAGLGEPLDLAVQEALGDETAAVADPKEGSSSGRTADSRFLVRTEEGEPLAVLVTDRGADGANADMIPAIVDGLGLGLLNGRLRAARKAVALNLADSRARAVEAALDERRRVERNLHDGVQQAMLGVSAVLARTDLVSEPEALRVIAADARERLLRAQADLDRLTVGLQPVELARGGLAQALPALAAGATLDVHLTMPATAFEEKLPSAFEATAYFVVAEALSNAVKHARAKVVHVSVRRTGGSLQVIIIDDGIGGARIEPGGGLAGLSERVSAVGGYLDVLSEPNQGSRIHARMPLPE